MYAVWFYKRGWLVDSCAGGAYSDDERDAKTWRTADEAQLEMDAAEMGKVGVDYEIVPVG